MPPRNAVASCPSVSSLRDSHSYKAILTPSARGFPRLSRVALPVCGSLYLRDFGRFPLRWPTCVSSLPQTNSDRTFS
ncbi:hypothetical protein CEV34_4994 [Brucella pseudogrignonensis]|uniref:Uncharacterized protein n=1 Tax=Brucella pseudogrignonensis TaxID=419475 RepID=A0A256G3U2_9HYPH|nr:hypothetical protein CEV34_4994 [Brucella pseudogrignonensis]